MQLAVNGDALGIVNPSPWVISTISVPILSQSKHWINDPNDSPTIRNASPSPGQLLLPDPKGIILNPSLTPANPSNLSGLNFSGSSQYLGSLWIEYKLIISIVPAGIRILSTDVLCHLFTAVFDQVLHKSVSIPLHLHKPLLQAPEHLLQPRHKVSHVGCPTDEYNLCEDLPEPVCLFQILHVLAEIPFPGDHPHHQTWPVRENDVVLRQTLLCRRRGGDQQDFPGAELEEEDGAIAVGDIG
nr:unnamed protein product [Ipomoea batatas]